MPVYVGRCTVIKVALHQGLVDNRSIFEVSTLGVSKKPEKYKM